MSLLSVSGIGKKDERGFEMSDISFTQEPFQHLAVAGETGSGKSTLLKIIAGLVQPDAGEVLLNKKPVPGPNDKLIPGIPEIAYLSQQFELPRHYRVEEILEYANQLPGREPGLLYEICQINHLLQRKTDQLSGGEQQRIAIARLLTTAPKLFLLDEPYSNADMIHKQLLKTIIRDIGERLKITCIMVSHDPLDTLPWAKQVIVLQEGQLVQEGTPLDVYYQPLDTYVAGLFGKYNMLTPAEVALFPGLNAWELDNGNFMVRPDGFELGSGDENAVEGTVENVFFYGSYFDVDVRIGRKKVVVRKMEGGVNAGDVVRVQGKR